ncbi:hypothetical protein ACFDTO_36925 [Microbacteriaceae bacterium 4G12]
MFNKRKQQMPPSPPAQMQAMQPHPQYQQFAPGQQYMPQQQYLGQEQYIPQQQYPPQQQYWERQQHPQTGQIPTEPTPQQIQQAVGTKYLYLKQPVLHTVAPWVQYGLKEAQHTSMHHAMTEVAAIAYLIGKGYDPTMAHYIVESWEKHEHF